MNKPGTVAPSLQKFQFLQTVRARLRRESNYKFNKNFEEARNSPIATNNHLDYEIPNGDETRAGKSSAKLHLKRGGRRNVAREVFGEVQKALVILHETFHHKQAELKTSPPWHGN